MRIGFLMLMAAALYGQNGAADWPMFNRDLAATRYSPLTQINAKNVSKLTRAWSYKLSRHPSSGSITGGSEFTPIVVAGVMYLTNINAVIALEPDTGKELWRYELANGQVSRRGVAYWPGDQHNPARVIFTTGRKVMA